MPSGIPSYSLKKSRRPLELSRDSEHLNLTDLEMAGLHQFNELIACTQVLRSRVDRLDNFFTENHGRLVFTLAEQGHIFALASVLGILRELTKEGCHHSLLSVLQQCREYEFSHWRHGPVGGACIFGHDEIVALLFRELERIDPSQAALRHELEAGAPEADGFRAYEPYVDQHFTLIVAAKNGHQSVVGVLFDEYANVDPSGSLVAEALRPYAYFVPDILPEGRQELSSVLGDSISSVRWFKHRECGLAMVRRVMDECWQADPSGGLTRELLRQLHYGVPDLMDRVSLSGIDGGCFDMMRMLLGEYEKADPDGHLLRQALSSRGHKVLFHVFQSRDLQAVTLLLDVYAKQGLMKDAVDNLRQFIEHDDNSIVDEMFVGKELNQHRFYHDQLHGESLAEYEQRSDLMFKVRLVQLLDSLGESKGRQQTRERESFDSYFLRDSW